MFHSSLHTFVAEHPDLKLPDITRMLSEEWKALTEEEKQPYKDAAAADAQRAKAANEAAGITGKPRKAGGRKRKGATQPEAAENEVKPAPATKRQHALAAAAGDGGSDDEQQREECDWAAHPAEAILAETSTGKVSCRVCMRQPSTHPLPTVCGQAPRHAAV